MIVASCNNNSHKHSIIYQTVPVCIDDGVSKSFRIDEMTILHWANKPPSTNRHSPNSCQKIDLSVVDFERPLNCCVIWCFDSNKYLMSH